MQILIIGGGSMGKAIAQGLLSQNTKLELTVVEKDLETQKTLKEFTTNILDGIIDFKSQHFDAVILATKPDGIESVTKELVNNIEANTLIISIAAGITTTSIENIMINFPVIRAMPNLAALVGESATAICAGMFASDDHLLLAQQLLIAIGKVVVVNEDQMNLVTGISGSGPAYYYLLTQYLIETGVAQGLDMQTAKILSEQTLIGAAKTVSLGNESVEDLRKKVTSKGGTTQAAIDSFGIDGLDKIVRSAVIAATHRAEELA